MNKKLIDQLQKEANTGGTTPKNVDLLVELIVRECARICFENGASYAYSFTPKKAQLAESSSVYCGQLIKKRFGIK